MDRVDGSHMKHPLLRRMRGQAFVGHLDCDVDGSLIVTDGLLYLARIASRSRQLLPRSLRALMVIAAVIIAVDYTNNSILSVLLLRTDCAWSKDTRLLDRSSLSNMVAPCLTGCSRTTNRYFGAISPRSRYVRELKPRRLRGKRDARSCE